MIFALFENTKTSLSRIHHWKITNNEFSREDGIKFHKDCDNQGIIINNYNTKIINNNIIKYFIITKKNIIFLYSCVLLLLLYFLGLTLAIMHSNDEPNSIFGGMAAPSWNSKNEYVKDPKEYCSWLFKIEIMDN